LNATAFPGFLKYTGLVVEKNGFRVVENSQKTRVSGSRNPGWKHYYWGPLKAEYWIMMWSEIPWGGCEKGDRGKCLACVPSNTSLYITLKMIVYENMKPIEHVLLHPICILSHLMCACKHCNIKLSLYYWTNWSCWWIYHFKKPRFKAFFIIKPWHPGRLKITDQKSGWKKTQWEPWSHDQNPYYHKFATALLSMFSSTYAYDLCSQLWTLLSLVMGVAWSMKILVRDFVYNPEGRKI